MQKYRIFHRRLLLACIMLWGLLVPSAFAAVQLTPVAEPFAPGQFRSTSTCPSVVGKSVYTPVVTAPYSESPYYSPVRRAWGDPEGYDPAIGEVDDPAPMGEPLILLAMACLYALWRAIRFFRTTRMRARSS